MSPSGYKEKNDWKMKNCFKILLVFIPLFVACNREESDNLSNDMAIRMSVSVEQTKALITEENIENSSIGIYGYKEQISNQSNKYLVFENQKLTFSDSWNYTPVKYWDTQTNYSFIAYAPYEENAEKIAIAGFESITISNIPQWQDADAFESKDYIIALSDSAATSYINSGGVDLKFHHILANLKISAYNEGDSEFEIQSISIGGNEDGQGVPAVDAVRSFTQYFRTTGLNADQKPAMEFNNVDLQGDGVVLMNGNKTITAESALVANNLVAPFVAGAELQLIISYTENGETKTATVNSGISEFQSDAVYTINLKFTSTVADEPAGPSGPGVEVVSGYTYSLDNSGHNFLCVNSNGELEVKEVPTLSESIWRTASGTDFYGKENKQPLYIEQNGVLYYLALAPDGVNLTLTTDIQQAMLLYLYVSNADAPPFLVADINIDSNSIMRYVVYVNGQWILNQYNAGVYIHKVYNMIRCDVDENGFAGPAIFFNIRWDNPNFDYENKVMNYDNIQRLSFNYLLTKDLAFELSFNGVQTMFSYDANRYSMYTQPEGWKCNNGVNDNFDLQWSVAAVDGTDISQYAEMQNNALIYKQKCPVDTDVIVTLTCTHRTNPEIVKVGYYRLTLKGANSSI